MDLQKLGFKFFAQDAAGLDLLKLIPVFHRWIQNTALDDVLIDVADYSHVWAGPGVLLIAHEGNYGLDEAGDRRGVVYYSKQSLPGDLAQRLTAACRKSLQAARLLEQEEEFKDSLKLSGNELQFFANDRLLAPNTDDTFAQLEPPLRALLDKLFAGAPYTLERETDPRERFTVNVRAQEPVAVETLLSRLAA
jgi:hypothetical protein